MLNHDANSAPNGASRLLCGSACCINQAIMAQIMWRFLLMRGWKTTERFNAHGMICCAAVVA